MEAFSQRNEASANKGTYLKIIKMKYNNRMNQY